MRPRATLIITVRAGPLPAIFGLHIATYILCDIAGKPIQNPLPIKNRRKLYERLLRDLLVRESRIAGRDVGYVTYNAYFFRPELTEG